jgi:hypothetical protein
LPGLVQLGFEWMSAVHAESSLGRDGPPTVGAGRSDRRMIAGESRAVGSQPCVTIAFLGTDANSLGAP